MFFSIVFIHGIQGHPRKTWTYGEVPEKKNKSHQIFSFKKEPKPTSGEASSTQTEFLFWPGDLLSKDFTNVRILTYGYDSHVSHFFAGAASQNNINAHGRSLLNALELNRRYNPKRPLIFMAHSLGGIVLKEVGLIKYG